MRIYFDENFSPRLVAGIRELQNGLPAESVEVCSIAEDFGKGSTDEEWIPRVASRHGVILTQDLNIHRMRTQYEICMQSKVGVLFFKPPAKGWSYWQVVECVLKHWAQIKERARETPKPFAYLIDVRTHKWRKY